MEVKIITNITPDGCVVQDLIDGSDPSPLRPSFMRQVLNTKEAAVRKALMDLGWTPPEDGVPAPSGTLRPMDTAPRDGTFVLLFGLSGYRSTPWRASICQYDAEYRPLQPWVDAAGDSFLDSGGDPIGWLPRPGEELDTTAVDLSTARAEGYRDGVAAERERIKKWLDGTTSPFDCEEGDDKD